MLDILGAIGLTASSLVLVAVLASAYPARARLRLALGFAGWFVVLVASSALGAFHPVAGLGTVGLGLAIVLPIAFMAYFGLGSRERRQPLYAGELPVMIAAHGVRALGLYFILLHAAGRLPAPFAPTAGWGDIIIGVTALPMAWAVKHDISAAKPLALAWTLLGALDLIVALGLGVASAADAPFRLFHGSPDSSVMTTLPWIIIPAFIVPILLMLHAAALIRLWPARLSRQAAAAATEGY
jgi:hypothetical protein